MVKFQNSDISG